jgi:hypothetical protein
MNSIEILERRILEASDRSARIREFRDDVLWHRPLPKVISFRTIAIGDRSVTICLMDVSRELGRGRCYWLKPDIRSAA